MRIFKRLGILAVSALSVLVCPSSPVWADYSWVPAAPLGVPRNSFGVATLQDGRLLLTGGNTSNGVSLSLCEIYDPTTGSWNATGSLPEARRGVATVTLQDGRVLQAGGGTSFGEQLTAAIYNPVSGQWTPTAAMPETLKSITMTRLQDGRVLALGGSGVGRGGIYDPASGTWSVTSSHSGFGREYATSTLLPDGRVLVAGGNSVSSALVYSPATNSWSPTGALQAPRWAHTATLLADGRVIIVGGVSNATGLSLPSSEIYDPQTNGWTAGPSLAQSRHYHGASLLPNGSVLLVGGLQKTASGFATLSSAAIYDSVTNTIGAAPSLAVGSYSLKAASLPDGSVLAMGGWDTGPLSNVERLVQLPSAMVGDGRASEGAQGTRSLNFPIQLSAGAPVAVVASYTTQPQTASAPGDYTTTSGTLTIPVGSSQAMVQVPVVGDTMPEGTETFNLVLSGVTGASVADAEGMGTILDDDPTAGDFDGDGNSDVVVYREGAWLFYDFATGSALPGVFTGQPSAGCIPAPGDFDGDGQVQFSQLCGDKWYFYAADGSLAKTITTGGTGSDKPVPADYDADGKDDVAVYRLGAWFFYNYQTGALGSSVFTGHPPHQTGGTSTPVPFDRDGDGKADLSIYSGGPWHFYNADGSYLKGVWTGSVAGDIPVAGDYDGDGIEDIVVWRAGAWLFYDFASGAYLPGVSRYTGAPASQNGGIPLPAPIDVDGDGRLNLAVYSGGPWHFYNSDGTYDKGIWVGAVAGDQPISRRQLP